MKKQYKVVRNMKNKNNYKFNVSTLFELVPHFSFEIQLQEN